MHNILVLGGTIEATRLVAELARAGLGTTLSYAGRVERPKPQPVPVRVGGFGGVEGLVAYLRAHHVTHLIDATHPFAAQMSAHAVQAAQITGVPLLALTRPAWTPVPGDDWHRVPDIPAAVAALAGPARRILLALGRMHLAGFAAQPQHHYVLRLVDPPEVPPPLPDHHIILDRGPFDAAADEALMRAHRIDLVVSKNAGGSGAQAKLVAARALGLPVLMIDRPALPNRREAHDIAAVLDWITG
ncbi:cobalt-precorrin-6A reductase [Roseinatronobacter monicus]|uniref:cobalt-precorrin-6A reductase n=1 Tax=Roseinatronobacter monicus TaxID=393481 RepID=UPI001151D83E|nr:cobalt-precorrin-6A reductase [Roseinatronobacter monicus]